MRKSFPDTSFLDSLKTFSYIAYSSPFEGNSNSMSQRSQKLKNTTNV